MSERVEIFIDGSNFYNGLLSQFNDGRYNMQNLVHRIVGNRSLVCVNFYAGSPSQTLEPQKYNGQQKYFAILRALPIPVTIYSRPLQYSQGIPREKGIDARIVQDMLVGAFDHRYDVAVLLSGDQDFRDVVEFIHTRFPVKLETFFPNTRIHLYHAASHCFSVARLIDRVFFNEISLSSPKSVKKIPPAGTSEGSPSS